MATYHVGGREAPLPLLRAGAGSQRLWGVRGVPGWFSCCCWGCSDWKWDHPVSHDVIVALSSVPRATDRERLSRVALDGWAIVPGCHCPRCLGNLRRDFRTTELRVDLEHADEILAAMGVPSGELRRTRSARGLPLSPVKW